MWVGGAFDPAPEAVPAPAPYPDGAYAMTPSQFDARVESWTARQADFDASLRRDRAFAHLTRQREIRAAGAAAFVALLPLTSVFGALTALPDAPQADPATRALALHGACDRWAGAPVTSGNLEWDQGPFRVGGVDVKAAEVERLAPRVAATLLVVAAAIALGIVYGVCARAAAMRRAATSRNARRVSSGEEKETASTATTAALEMRVSPPRVSPPPPPPPPALRPPGSLGPLSRTPIPPPPPPPWTPRAGSSATASPPPRAGGGGSPPASALRRSLAMGKLRRAVSSRANARLREVNAAANEAPTPEVARRVKTKLDPSDVLAELQAKSPFLAEANREAESHAFAIASLREALEKMDGTASAETIEELRDRAEQTLAALTDEPRVLRLLEFPEARLESLRVAAANAKRLSECRKRAENLARAFSSRASTASSLFAEHAQALAVLDACVSTADAVAASRGADERRFRDAGIAFDWRLIEATREAAVGMCGARLRSALARCAAARERLEETEGILRKDEEKENDAEVLPGLGASSRAFGVSAIPSRPKSLERRSTKKDILPEGEDGHFFESSALRARDANGAETVPPSSPFTQRHHVFVRASETPPPTHPGASRFAARLDSRLSISDAATNLWVLKSACDLAYRAYLRCGGVDACLDAAASLAEFEIVAFGEEAWREAEIVAARAAAAARVRSY